MPAEVKMEQMNLTYRVTISERPASSDLYEEFKSVIKRSKGIEASWVLSGWIISSITYPTYPNAEGKDIVYGDGGFEVSNIAPANVEHFKELLSDLCKKLNLQLKP